MEGTGETDPWWGKGDSNSRSRREVAVRFATSACSVEHHSVSKIQAAGIKQLASSAHIYDDAVLCDGDMPVRQGLDHADRW